MNVITKGEGGFRNDYANVIFALSNAEFDYGGGLETDKSDYVICERPRIIIIHGSAFELSHLRAFFS